LRTSAATAEILRDFQNFGQQYFGNVIEGSDGKLYGTSRGGGTLNRGSVFRVEKNGTGFAQLKSFDCAADSCDPRAGLIEGSDGKLYGTSYAGGVSNGGTVFSIEKNGTGFALLKSFDCVTGGCFPVGGLIEGSDGNLYGTTHSSNSSGGTVFTMAKNGTGYTLLKTFDCFGDACNPQAKVIEGTDGNLYGTTVNGGTSGGGTIFTIAKNGSGYILLKSFDCTNPADGCNPSIGGLTEGSDGNLYGMTDVGGTTNQGTIFTVAKNGSGFTFLKSFDCTDSCRPQASLLEVSDGNL
jgi:uncharacterized repeat protein (TIGR03803 family)